MRRTGRHFLQVPGPTNVPDRVLRAMDHPVIDHRGPEFASLTNEILEHLRPVFKTTGHVVIFPSSGTGAAEAALVNTLSPGDRVLIFETGHFSQLWRGIAERLGLEVDYVPGNWRRGASETELETRLVGDTRQMIKAVVVVHNETSTGVTSRIAAIRATMTRIGHPALLIVDAVSSLGSIDFRQDEWEVDVSVVGSQKGLMLPPGLGFNAVSDKAVAASRTAKLARNYWDWRPVIDQNRAGFFPYTPATNLLFALREGLRMLHEEGLQNVFARHDRHARAARAAVKAWELEIVCEDPREYSSSMTAFFMPDGHDGDRFRSLVLEHFDMSLGGGLSKLAGKVVRIGHLGSFNDLMLAGTLSGIEMGLRIATVPHRDGGVTAALRSLSQEIVAEQPIGSRS
ncbi:MAG TPA: aminotransferase class V-fold PLP-dependent enzyme [Vicinamibacterales bacterium]|nr:aminotransferase class V-fold PLP-dependent enzyme [Vicinamibacterales bacterium]